MAKRTITHFRVTAGLFTDITNVLLSLPARTSRELLNRIESPECEALFAVDIQPENPPKPRKKVARKKRSA